MQSYVIFSYYLKYVLIKSFSVRNRVTDCGYWRIGDFFISLHPDSYAVGGMKGLEKPIMPEWAGIITGLI